MLRPLEGPLLWLPGNQLRPSFKCPPPSSCSPTAYCFLWGGGAFWGAGPRLLVAPLDLLEQVCAVSPQGREILEPSAQVQKEKW